MVSRDVAAPETQGEVTHTTAQLNVETLRSMESFDDALAALIDAGITPADSSEYGDGFELATDRDKESLVGTPFVVLSYAVADGDYGDKFVSLRIMTANGRKLILNDGSTGIKDQALNTILPARGTLVGLHCRHGLRASTYTFCEDCKTIGKSNSSQCPQCGHSPMKPAATFYFDVSK